MASKRPYSKRELEELKKKEDLQRSAEVFSEFVQTFEQTESPAKKFTAFVRGGVVKPGTGEESHSGDPSERLYVHQPKVAVSSSSTAKPSRFQSGHHAAPPSQPAVVIPQPPQPQKPVLVKKEKIKKKSNLEMFKEELKQIQEEREERKRLKEQIQKIETKLGVPTSLPPSTSSYIDDDSRIFDGTYDLSGEAGSTNLYMGNLAPNITEDQLCEIFGRYGPIASVKIMYPRGEEKEEYRGARATLCGFVAYMARIDAERAMVNLRGKDVMGYEMRLGWGKTVNIPAFPIYVPPRMKELLEPPPFTGLPFNAQPSKDDLDALPKDLSVLSYEDTINVLSRSTVRVCQPQDRSLLLIIHRVIEFVIREGPIFEAMLMQRERENPLYRFLFDNRCNEHVYYRWKLFSILQGDTPTQWKTKEFHMFEGGPLWKPPPLNIYTAGMPEELIRDEPPSKYVKERDNRRGSVPKESTKGLTDENREELKKMLADLTASRDSVADAMVFCIDHSDGADEIVASICDSIANDDPPIKKLAKIYLISDILHNCSGVHVQNAWYYRNGFEQKFPFIFTQIRNAHKSFEGRLKAEHYKQKVMNCFRAWEDWAVYPPKYLIRLQNIFLGLEPGEDPEEPLDGKPLEASPERVDEVKVDADLDGMPFEEDLDGAPLEEEPVGGTASSDGKSSSSAAPVGFAPSRWETLDPEKVKAQAITTSKWEQLEADEKSKSTKGQTLDDAIREQLREIEMRVMKYQDELETGKRSRHSGETVASQVAKYRKQLISNSSGSSNRSDTTGSRRDSHRSDSDGRRSERDSRDRRDSRQSAKRTRSRSRSRSRERITGSDSRYQQHKSQRTAETHRGNSRRSRSRSRSRDRHRRH